MAQRRKKKDVIVTDEMGTMFLAVYRSASHAVCFLTIAEEDLWADKSRKQKRTISRVMRICHLYWYTFLFPRIQKSKLRPIWCFVLSQCEIVFPELVFLPPPPPPPPPPPSTDYFSVVAGFVMVVAVLGGVLLFLLPLFVCVLFVWLLFFVSVFGVFCCCCFCVGFLLWFLCVFWFLCECFCWVFFLLVIINFIYFYFSFLNHISESI